MSHEIQDSNEKHPVPADPFLELRGIAKDLFQELGGGEAFIRNERENFSERSK